MRTKPVSVSTAVTAGLPRCWRRRRQMRDSHGGKRSSRHSGGNSSARISSLFAVGNPLAGGVALGQHKRRGETGGRQHFIRGQHVGLADSLSAEFDRQPPGDDSRLRQQIQLLFGPVVHGGESRVPIPRACRTVREACPPRVRRPEEQTGSLADLCSRRSIFRKSLSPSRLWPAGLQIAVERFEKLRHFSLGMRIAYLARDLNSGGQNTPRFQWPALLGQDLSLLEVRRDVIRVPVDHGLELRQPRSTSPSGHRPWPTRTVKTRRLDRTRAVLPVVSGLANFASCGPSSGPMRSAVTFIQAI